MLRYLRILCNIAVYTVISLDMLRYWPIFLQCEHVLFVPMLILKKICCDITVYFSKNVLHILFEQYAAIFYHISVVWTSNKICGDISKYFRISGNIAAYPVISPDILCVCEHMLGIKYHAISQHILCLVWTDFKEALLWYELTGPGVTHRDKGVIIKSEIKMLVMSA